MMGGGVTAVMVLVECLEVGLSTISKAAMNRGMSDLIFICYSNALAIFFLLPSSLFFYTKIRPSPPPLTWPIIFRILILGEISCLVQILMNFGVWYSSPTLHSAMVDLIPAFTFLLALISRMEKLDMRANSTWAKSIGTIVSIIGALTVSLYKGLPLLTNPNNKNLVINLITSSSENEQQYSDWAIGWTLLAAGALCLSFLHIVRTWIMRDYPEELMVTLISCIFVTSQSTLVALLFEKDPNAWILKLDVELIAICYSAFFGVMIRNIVHTYACRKKGPVYASMFKPLGVVFALIMGISFLGDTLYLGSLVGAAVIAVGFYTVIWGKAQEEIKKKVVEESSPNLPLLKSKSIET